MNNPISETTGEAEEIADLILHKTGRGLMENDFRLFADCFELPQMMETVEGRRLLKTEADVRRAFDAVRAYFDREGVTDLVRTVVAATFTDADTVETTHVSRLLKAGGEVFRSPYPTYSVIKRQNGVWRVHYAHYVILDSRKHNEALIAWGFDEND